jgi:protein involved in polysaccharide export with SLBB domain
MMSRFRTWGLLLAIGLSLAGCYNDFGPVVFDSPPITPETLGTTTHVLPGDKVRVIVYGEDTLSGVYEVGPTGTVSMPLVGTLNVVGRTRAELEHLIAGKISGYVKDAKVTVWINDFRPLYIMGEVLRPGEYPYHSGINALTAVSTAGGLTYRASRTTVLVQHPGEEIWHEYDLTSAVLLAPGDLIRIPERFF